MARQRFIHPQIWNSDAFCALPTDTARLLFIGIFSTADDEGRRKGSVRSLRGDIFPQGDHSLEEVTEARAAVAEAGLIRLYRVDGELYLDIPKWKNYQRPNHPTPSRLPAYKVALREDSRSNDVGLQEDSRTCPAWEGSDRVGSGREGSGGEGGDRGGRGGPSADPPVENSPPRSHPIAPGGEDAASTPTTSETPPTYTPTRGSEQGEERASPESPETDAPDQEHMRQLRDILDRTPDNGRQPRRRRAPGLTRIGDLDTGPPSADEEKRRAELREQARRLETGEDLDEFIPAPPDTGELT